MGIKMVNIDKVLSVRDDSEMQMAKSDLYNLAKNSVQLYKIVKELPELEGWTQAKITKAADYIASVLRYMEYEMRGQEAELDEMGTSGGTSSGAIAASPMPMGKKMIKREAASNWKATVQSIPRTEPFKHKAIVIKTPGGKTYTFDTEAEARSMFPDSWDKIKSGKLGHKVTGLSEDTDDLSPFAKIDHREPLIAKLEKLPQGNESFEHARHWAIEELKQGNMLKARYWLYKLKKNKAINEGKETATKPTMKTWEVNYDYGPHQSESVTVKAKTKEEAETKGMKLGKKGHRSIMINYVKEIKKDVKEEKQKGVNGKACWDGYKRMGTKKKGGKTVDNCVPIKKKK